MNTYICILRGINVSGKNLIKMDALKELFRTSGYENVQTYIQSGNVIFQSKEAKPKALEAKISASILKSFGMTVPVLVLTKEKLFQVMSSNPFLHRDGIDLTKLHVTFLSAVPDKTGIVKIGEGSYGRDEWFWKEDAIYLYCPEGYGNTKLSNTFLENKLKVSATTRNWKTVGELLRLSGELTSK